MKFRARWAAATHSTITTAFMKSNIMLVAAICLILVGCATSDVSKDFSLSPDSKSGLLIGSVKYLGPVSGYRVYFKGLNNNEKGYFEAGSSNAVSLFSTRYDFPDVGGKLQVTELIPGNYEIYGWAVQSGVAHLSQTTPFSIKFKIEPGKATYIGSFIFTVTNKLAATVTATKVDFADAFDEDIKVLHRLYPKLAMADIYRGVDLGLRKEDIGGASSVYFNLAPFFIPGAPIKH
ncbi:hypothetical protein SCL_1895 [Sulfuricaulis limicola]|uniref:Uncharacterized protein n=1 Tax=Sulfuricaulis limicola TaxID=1620215 RepID=A0A1B4XHA9_9GAMM|nr:hypothetical protein [Sulfuricaulis limicola]BAV34186.1 hypothetical protein SCL_1895 [Sulfuricaulis limicola]